MHKWYKPLLRLLNPPPAEISEEMKQLLVNLDKSSESSKLLKETADRITANRGISDPTMSHISRDL